jgi:hypothetical protein
VDVGDPAIRPQLIEDGTICRVEGHYRNIIA